ncbi:unnamed protein product [Ostreobium quekettii]|uniref:Uncharacterized protein n=1 Tax=Ostreobium quekettii TaxID=121088 RepID=A0A8S1INN8_9CHLO|nr:unnamed protein product [Ostreobium quekettii]CAD7695924.1 unnamed protein product [Ostreobium quekettii]
MEAQPEPAWWRVLEVAHSPRRVSASSFRCLRIWVGTLICWSSGVHAKKGFNFSDMYVWYICSVASRTRLLSNRYCYLNDATVSWYGIASDQDGYGLHLVVINGAD